MQAPAFLTRLSSVPRAIVAALLSLGSLFMLLILVVFVATAGVTFWISSTTSGQNFLSAQLTALTADSGYEIAVGPIRARGAGGVMVDYITVTASGAPVADVTGLTVTPSLAALLTRVASVDIHLRQLVIHPAPEDPQAPLDNAPTPLSLPNETELSAMLESIPVDAARLDRLRIDQIAFANADGMIEDPPMALTLGVNFDKDARGASLSASAALNGMSDEPLNADLRARAELAGENPAITLEALRIIQGEIDQTISGHLDLARDAADLRDLQLWLETIFEDQPARLSATLAQGDAPALRDIRLTGPGITAEGEVSRSADNVWQGRLQSVLSLPELAKVFPPAGDIPLREELKIDLSFTGETLSLVVPRLAYAPLDVRNIALSTSPLTDGRAGDRSVTLSLTENGSGAKMTAAAQLRQSDTGQWRAKAVDATLTAGRAGTVKLTGSAAEDALDLRLATSSLRLDRLRGILSPGDALPAVLLDKTEIKLQGTAAQPIIDWASRITPTSLPKGVSAIRADASGRIAGGMASNTINLTGRGLRTGRITAEFPLVLSLQPFEFALPDEGLRAEGRVAGDIAALNAFLPVGTRLSGPLNINVDASGSIANPVASGTLRWTQGRATEGSSGFSLQNIDLAARFDRDRITIEKLAARDATRGRLNASGSLGLATGVWPADIVVNLQDIDPFQKTVAAADMPVIDGVFSADLALKGERNSYLLNGTVRSSRLEIQLPERFNSSVPQLNIIEKRTANATDLPGADALRLDISVNVPRQIYVRGWGLDAEFGGALEISGTAATPVVNGMLESIRGRFEEFGRRFTLSRARLDFRGAVPPSPFLDIVADTSVDGIDASVVLTGSATAPKISFTSTPSMPQEDVLSHILFGQNRADISATQALQLAQTLRRFSGAGGAGLDPLGALRSGIGLDDLSVDSSNEGGASVGAGKYLADDVYLELNSGNETTAGGAKLKIDLTPNIKAESRIGGDSQAGGGLFWEWEY